MEDFSQYHVFKGHYYTITGLVVTEDDSLLISSAYDGNIRLWDLTEFLCMSVLVTH